MAKHSLGSLLVRAYNNVFAQWRRLRPKKRLIVNGCCGHETTGCHNCLSSSVGGMRERLAKTFDAPADPLPANQLPDVAGPIVRRFVAWLLPQFRGETLDAVRVEYLFYELACVEEEPLLESAVLFENLAANGILRSEAPRELQPHEWRYRRDVRRGIKRPQVDTYRIVPQTVCTTPDGTEHHWIDASDGAYQFVHVCAHPVQLFGRPIKPRPGSL